MPEAVQQMYNNEYGFKVGYANGKLYYDGDVETSNTVSKSAGIAWMKELGKGVSKGSLVFGYDLAIRTYGETAGQEISAVDGGKSGGENYPVAYVDLNDFNSNGVHKNFDANSPYGRTVNLGRIVEHDF